MGAFGGLVMTNRGLALQAKAQAGAELRYTRVAIGDGYLSGQSIATLNNLINERMSLDITKLKVLGQGRAVIGTVLTNQGITTGFYFREIGIFALDPDEGEILYAYANAGPNAEYIPPGGGPDVVEKHIDSVVVVGQAPNVTATIDKSLVFATLKDMSDHRTAKVLDHPDGSVTVEKLADGAVTDNKIGDRTISDTSSPSGNSGKLTTLLGWLAYMIRAITGKSSWNTAPATNLEETKAHMDATTGVHGATSAATPNTLVQRDAQGRIKAAAPSASDDVARKEEVDAKLSLSGGTMTGDINSSAADFQIGKTVDTGRIIIRGGSSGSVTNGANIHIEGINYGGAGSGGNVRINLPSGKNLLVNGNKTWHAGNDGAGSGLDADLIRGMDPNRFIFGDLAYGTTNYSGDLNAIAKSGFYYATTGHTNSPTGRNGFLIHSNGPADTNYAFQIFQTAFQNQLFVRQKSAGIWGNWVELYHAENLPYETGTWTPDLRFGGSNAGIAYAFRGGQYTRIANVVYWTFEIVLSSKGSASGTATITGLPFNKGAGLSFYHNVSRTRNMTIPSGQWVTSDISSSGSTIYLRTNAASSITNAEFANNSELCASGFFFI